MTLTSELIRGILRGPMVLEGNRPLSERLSSLCAGTASLLGCDRSSIFLWDGEVYRGSFNWGNPPELASAFHEYTVGRTASLVRAIESNPSHVVMNDAQSHPATKAIADVAGIHSIVAARMIEPDGTPVGIMTAEFCEQIRRFSDLEAQITRSAAHLAQAAILNDREHQRRIELSRSLVAVEDNERRRISRDIHDDALQRSFALCLRLEDLQSRVADPKVRSELASILAECRTSSEVLRGITTAVHPEAFDIEVLSVALQDLLTPLAVQCGWHGKVVDESRAEISDVGRRAFVRIARQALDNVREHAEAGHVSIFVSEEIETITMSITDDGRGFDPRQARSGGLGLTSMRERAVAVGGQLEIDSQPGMGTTINVSVPVSAPSSGHRGVRQ